MAVNGGNLPRRAGLKVKIPMDYYVKLQELKTGGCNISDTVEIALERYFATRWPELTPQ